MKNSRESYQNSRQKLLRIILKSSSKTHKNQILDTLQNSSRTIFKYSSKSLWNILRYLDKKIVYQRNLQSHIFIKSLCLYEVSHISLVDVFSSLHMTLILFMPHTCILYPSEDVKTLSSKCFSG